MSWLDEEELKAFGAAGFGVKVSRQAVIFGHKNIKLGDNVRIDANVMLLAAAEGAWITFGNHVHVGVQAIILGSGGVALGDYTAVGFASQLVSASDDFSGDFLIGPSFSAGLINVTKAPVVFEDFAVVGASCVVLPGVRMKKGSVAGAMTCLRRSTDPWRCYSGNPAKDIRGRSMKVMQLAKQWEIEWKTATSTF